jgi:hypothetical protein
MNVATMLVSGNPSKDGARNQHPKAFQVHELVPHTLAHTVGHLDSKDWVITQHFWKPMSSTDAAQSKTVGRGFVAILFWFCFLFDSVYSHLRKLTPLTALMAVSFLQKTMFLPHLAWRTSGTSCTQTRDWAECSSITANREVMTWSVATTNIGIFT